MRRSLILALAFLATAATPAPEKLPLPTLDPAVKETLVSYLKAHPQSPEDYVVSKFKDHDVVWLGEMHRIKHDPELVAELIPKLYKAGIRTLATEFARREEQPLIERLVNAPKYDEALAREIQLRSDPSWGYREYVDIYRAAWELNHGLKKGAPRFRILALNDSLHWDLLKAPEDAKNTELRQKVFANFDEKHWADVILQTVNKGEKVLVYSGIHHAFTRFNQPSFNAKNELEEFSHERAGNHVYAALGNRAMTIYLHAPWHGRDGYESPVTYPVDGVIDALMRELPSDRRRAGFDTAGTPFGDLADTQSIYSRGYEHLKLADYCDGYIIQKPISEYDGVTAIPNFINASNLEKARSTFPNPRFRSAGAADFNDAIAQDAQIRRRWANLQ